MARRTIAGTDWEHIPDDVLKPDPREYVSTLIDGSPFERLLWREVRHIQRKSKMTEWQCVVLNYYLYGLSLRQIAAVCDRDHSTIWQHLHAAFDKMASCPHRGLLTVMIENLGWPAVREHLAEKLETRLKSRG